MSKGELPLRVEVFSAGCSLCREKVRRVREFYGPKAAVRVIDMHSEEGAALAAGYGVTHVPAVVVVGRLVEGDGPEGDSSGKEGKK